jgi:hypothetical protein
MTQKKEVLKQMIQRLHDGESADDVKKEFAELLSNTTAAEISLAEEQLIKDGMPREEIRRLCDVHLAVFKESLEGETVLAPSGHPINTLMEEHRVLIDTAEELESIVTIEDNESISSKLPRIRHLVQHFKDSERHYQREENVLFPILEKHGITEPPAVMWTEHDQIRETEKRLFELVSGTDDDILRNLEQTRALSTKMRELLSSHFYKENNILFPTAMNVFTQNEWATTREEFDEIGYCCFTPHVEKPSTDPSSPDEDILKGEVFSDDELMFETGALSKDILEAVLDTLPVDITFVDADDRVRYFSNSSERIFVRSKAVIGRSVQLCHPQKSVHVVNQILDDFRSGERDSAEFWINMADKTIHIRYFAVRDAEEQYLGCLEVSQDITDIKGIGGEKRLLDE